MEISTDYIDGAQYQFLPFSKAIQQQLEKSPKNKKLQGRVDAIIERIERADTTLRGKYKFIVFRSDATQILHTQGGNIFIPDTLIKMAKNDSVLAFILSHEIGHWENGDIKEDKAKIPRSVGETYDAECLADKYSRDVTKILGYDIKYIDSFLEQLAKKNLRPDYNCVDEK